MNELNNKMLKFAGLRFEGEHHVVRLIHNPDFPNDFNACLEHLEPELYRRGLRYQLFRLQDGHMAKIFKPSKTWAECVAYAFDEKPATAFCKAVEQLMEKA